MKATWLGQSGFIFHLEAARILIDPFFSNVVEERQGLKRLLAPPLAIQDLKPDIILITHKHLDHFDPIVLPQIHRMYPKALIIGPESVMQLAATLFFDPTVLVLLPSGTSKTVRGVQLTAIPAVHSDPYSIGFVIQAGGEIIYVSGDTEFSESVIQTVKSVCQNKLHALFIVINGKLGNMNVQEAIETTALLNPQIAIPMHYGMFAENTEDPIVFIQGCRKRRLTAKQLIPGKETTI